MIQIDLKFHTASQADRRAFGECRDWKLFNLSGNRILDLGAHIGLFVYNMATRDMCSEFLCVEPSLSSYQFLQYNIVKISSAYPKITVNTINKAVVKDKLDGKVINIYEKDNSETSNTIIPTRGRTPKSVFGIGILTLLKQFNPTTIKCDIEGAEYDILDKIFVYPSVNEIGIEFHRIMQYPYHEYAISMHEAILKQGFSVVREPVFHKKYWNTVAIYRR